MEKEDLEEEPEVLVAVSVVLFATVSLADIFDDEPDDFLDEPQPDRLISKTADNKMHRSFFAFLLIEPPF